MLCVIRLKLKVFKQARYDLSENDKLIKTGENEMNI